MSRRRESYQEDGFGTFDSPPSLQEADDALYGIIEAMDETLEAEQRDALKIIDETTLSYKRAELTTTSLTLPDDVTQDELAEMGDILLRLQKSVQWWLGDWLNALEDREWGETYAALASKYSYEVVTLHNIASIAKRVDFSRRRESLSFGHHDAVASLKPAQQTRWLNFAEKNQASVGELRKAIRESKSGKVVSTLTMFKRRYKSFAQKQRAVVENATPDERQEMAEMLRRLADEIETSK